MAAAIHEGFQHWLGTTSLQSVVCPRHVLFAIRRKEQCFRLSFSPESHFSFKVGFVG
jgi:hypothetical protein